MKLARGILCAGMALLGCAGATAPAALPHAVAQCTEPSEPVAGTSEAYFLENGQDETAMAGLRPLLSDTLPAGSREVRLWHAATWVGVTALVRIRAVGDSVAGKLIVYAGSMIDTPPDSDAVLPRSCRLLGRGRGRLACVADFPTPVDWRDVLDSAEAHRVRALPRGGDVPRQHTVLDGDAIYVEVRQGDCYRVYGYGTPESETSPEYRDAAALKRIIFDLRQRWSPPSRTGGP